MRKYLDTILVALLTAVIAIIMLAWKPGYTPPVPEAATDPIEMEATPSARGLWLT